MGATTTASLDEIREQLSSIPPVVANLSPGWAVFDPADTGIGDFGTSHPYLGTPEIYPASAGHPERLIARYYHWVHDAARDNLLISAGLSPTPLETHRLDAVDFVISEDQSFGGYLVLASTRNEQELGPAVDSAITAIQALDPGADLAPTTRSSLHVGGSDFFLWMVERRTTRPIIDASLTLASITGLETRDNRARQNLLRDEIDGDRPNFLTAVADGHDLGPIRFMIRLPPIPAKISLSLWADGSFVLFLSGTHYSMKANVQNEGIQAVYDLAYLYLPRLIDFYTADSDWTNTRRLAYRAGARVKLGTRYSLIVPSSVTPV